MTDYTTTHIWQQNLPLAAMTALDKLILHEMLDHTVEGDSVYFYGDPQDYLELDPDDLQDAIEETPEDDPLRAYTIEKMVSDDVRVTVDFSSFDWARITQQILQRNPDIPHIGVIASYACTKMRREGFGGAVHFITADDIKSIDLMEVYEDLANGSCPQAG